MDYYDDSDIHVMVDSTTIITIVIITKNITMVADASCDAASYNAPDSNVVKCCEHILLFHCNGVLCNRL